MSNDLKRSGDEVEGHVDKQAKVEESTLTAGTNDAAKLENATGTEEQVKKPRPKGQKRKMAMLLAYAGTGYVGLQVQTNGRTIEGELMKALHAAGAISDDNAGNFQKVGWTRCARTDKGVHAVGNVVALKMLMFPGVMEAINEKLPPEIRVLELVRVAGSFHAKQACDSRKYEYLMPTSVFRPKEQPEAKFDKDQVEKLRTTMKLFEGTHNYHNYTVSVAPHEAQAMRYIMSWKVSDPFTMKSVELVRLSVHGQSFMRHHIRKMIGMATVVMRGEATTEDVEKSFDKLKMHVPMAPGLGLMLGECMYKYYNDKFKQSHTPIEFGHLTETMEKFKHEFIFPQMVDEQLQENAFGEFIQQLDEKSFTGEQFPYVDFSTKGDAAAEGQEKDKEDKGEKGKNGKQ